MSAGNRPSSTTGFSVGICATGFIKGIDRLIADVLAEKTNATTPLRKVLVIASGCSAEGMSDLKQAAQRDSRIDLTIEAARHGKANAVNQILGKMEGEYLVLLNADARPATRAVSNLLDVISADATVGVVSGKPLPEPGEGTSQRLAELMWDAHNECSLTLNHMNLSNHSSDELVAVRRTAVGRLPAGLVNDGAFFASTARRRGYSVRFCSQAVVRVRVPKKVSDTIGQRRRIIFGHTEVWRKTGLQPMNLESLMVTSPRIGLRLLVRTLARHPSFMSVLPIALVSEISATLLSVWDSLRHSSRHVVWRRYS